MMAVAPQDLAGWAGDSEEKATEMVEMRAVIVAVLQEYCSSSGEEEVMVMDKIRVTHRS